MDASSGHRPHVLGRRGEGLAVSYLREAGWTVMERNYRFGRREVDLIVQKGWLLAFVEEHVVGFVASRTVVHENHTYVSRK